MFPSRPRLLAIASLTLAACGEGRDPASAPRREAGDRPDVVLIVVDTLRRDRLSCYGHERATTPNLDRFAARAVRYDNAYSQAPWTTPSIGSMLTSQYPSALGIRGERSALAGDVVTLAEALDAAGYVTGAVVSHSFCSAEWGFDQGFDYFDDSHVLGHEAVTSPGVIDRALSFVEEFDGGAEPFFLWVHLFDPHCAYVEHAEHDFGGSGDYRGPIRSGQLFRRLLKLRPELGPEDVSELLRLYDSEIAFTDHHLGRLLEALDEDVLVVFTTDHGEEFLDHGRLGHAKTLFDEVLRAPLLIRYPGHPGGVVREPVALLDLYPTILDVAGLPIPSDLEGVSLAPGRALDPERVVFAETERGGGQRAAIAPGYKLVANRRSGEMSLFETASDPSEREALEADGHPVGERLAAALERFACEVRAERVAPQVEVDEAEAARLNDMGYGGGDDE